MHPDKNDDEEATKKFKNNNNAYHVLTQVCVCVLLFYW